MGTLVASDLINSMRTLPLTALISTMLVGVGLIVTGWWMHRFWAALATTLAAGLLGLRWGPEYGIQPIVAGVLAAVAAGCLSLSLVRVAVFVSCGLLSWMAAGAYMPKEPIPAIALVVGGLLGLAMYRFWIIAVTSAAGVLLVFYNAIVLLEKVMRFDAVQWTAGNSSTASAIVGGAALAALLLQYWIDKFRRNMAGWKQEYEELQAKASQSSAGGGWLGWLKKAA